MKIYGQMGDNSLPEAKCYIVRALRMDWPHGLKPILRGFASRSHFALISPKAKSQAQCKLTETEF
jgi:hypothetical protein